MVNIAAISLSATLENSVALAAELLLKTTLLLAAAHLAAMGLRRRSAAERHAFWLATLASLATLPLLIWLLSVWRIQSHAWFTLPLTVARFEAHAGTDGAGAASFPAIALAV